MFEISLIVFILQQVTLQLLLTIASSDVKSPRVQQRRAHRHNKFFQPQLCRINTEIERRFMLKNRILWGAV
jgi:hypothetical protein